MTCPNVAIYADTAEGVASVAADAVSTLGRGAGAILVGICRGVEAITRAIQEESRQASQRRNLEVAVATLLKHHYSFLREEGGDLFFVAHLQSGLSVACLTPAENSAGVSIDVDVAQGDPEKIGDCTQHTFQLARAMTQVGGNLRDQRIAAILNDAGWAEPQIQYAYRRERAKVEVHGVIQGRANTSLNRTFAEVFGVPVLERLPAMAVVR